MIKNRTSRAMNRGLIGYSITREFAPIQKKDVTRYVEATNDDPGLYTEDDTMAPPFYISRLLYPMFEHMMTLRGLDLNIFKMVHAQQEARWKHPIHLGEAVSVTMDILNIFDTPAGEMINLRTRAMVGDEETFEAVTGFLIRGTGDHRNAKKIPEPGHGKEIFRTEFQTFEGQQLKYARVSRDHNFMHTSNFLSKLAGLPRTIMHGVCITAMMANALRDSFFEGEMEKMKGFSIRYAKPVFPGEKVIIVGYETDRDGELYFEGFKESGKPVLKRGLLWFNK